MRILSKRILSELKQSQSAVFYYSSLASVFIYWTWNLGTVKWKSTLGNYFFVWLELGSSWSGEYYCGILQEGVLLWCQLWRIWTHFHNVGKHSDGCSRRHLRRCFKRSFYFEFYFGLRNVRFRYRYFEGVIPCYSVTCPCWRRFSGVLLLCSFSSDWWPGIVENPGMTTVYVFYSELAYLCILASWWFWFVINQILLWLMFGNYNQWDLEDNNWESAIRQ